MTKARDKHLEYVIVIVFLL